MFQFQEGMRIPITDKHIADPKDADDKDNPVCDAIIDFMSEQDPEKCYSAYVCFIDGQIDVYKKGTGGKVATLKTTTLLEDWLRNYYDGEKVSLFTLKIFHQRDDNDQIEDERLWVGIANGEKLTERQKDLQNRISKLSKLSSEITLHIEKLTDNPEDVDALEQEYQDLFSETVNKFGLPDYQTEFSYGGYVILEDGEEYPAFLLFKDSQLVQVSLPKKLNDEGLYLHSNSVKYDLTKKRDRYRLKRKGVIGCKFETPTTLSITYND